ncbi:MAG: aquaporin family protein [Spiroplasma poulsonii]|uniref:Putative glycerol uptake facilitator protein n=1 Tax=Spiroplasma poulsonii TaxID=2138 RepID=A0A2P6FEU1_9MOLU|nr:MIP/aquaporin family protein [Spiroplasma poulsonii]KAF0850326.1 putative glycerol uptake facilitator protein [Spiroplasma poulsonii]MBW1242254.1 aquaporin family protein [Spiroplasma poulsonii]PQM31973.1 putative glycerol uptake facilitator protein [Spiroplasma poulsonii]PWF94444.1 putative glycerol uptake facilitator protein [Spiroplasma poulsonii]PWF94600.1 putative glycerol uptake facilitator protein [Spiroplasma poulsonii]
MANTQLFFQHFGLEMFGTMLLIILGNGVVANILLKNTKGNGQGFFAITAGWGFAVLVGAMASSALKGVAHLNPAVTFAMVVQQTWFINNGWFLLPALLLGQVAGALIGQIIVDIFYWKHIKDTVNDNPDFILAMHATGPTYRPAFFNFFAEFIGTFLLVAAILAIGKYETFSLGTWGPLFVGLTVFGIGISLGGTTGYAINPVRDLIPRIVHFVLPLKNKGNSDWSYSWIPVVAPTCAGLATGGIFLLF